jgi:hypothetical protein
MNEDSALGWFLQSPDHPALCKPACGEVQIPFRRFNFVSSEAEHDEQKLPNNIMVYFMNLYLLRAEISPTLKKETRRNFTP